MKPEKILDNLNSFGKNSFLKIIDNIISEKPINSKEVDKIARSFQVVQVVRLVEGTFERNGNQ